MQGKWGQWHAQTAGHGTVYTPPATVQIHEEAFAECLTLKRNELQRATLPAVRYPLSLGGSVVKNNNNNNNIKTDEDANSGVSAVGNLSFHVKGNSTGLHAANFQLWTKQHASQQHRAHNGGGAASSCVARQKEYPSLWGKTKNTSVEYTEVCEWMGEVATVPPVWYERKVRGADSIDRVLDPSAHPHHGN